MSSSPEDIAGQVAADDRPVAVAVRAAVHSQVRVEMLDTVEQLEAAESLVNRTWTSEVSISMLRALRKAGNFVGGAYRADDLVGVCVGFFGFPARDELHSHLAVTAPAHRGSGVGRVLKLYQRAWAMERGVGQIQWTYDPLERPNAYVNLTKLAARPAEYLDNFYGDHGDGSSTSFPTDRVMVRWDLAAEEVVDAARGLAATLSLRELEARGCWRLLESDERNAPLEHPDTGDPVVLIGTPPNAARLRLDDPDLAMEWRLRLRHHLGDAMTAGAEVIGFVREGFYVLRRELS